MRLVARRAFDMVDDEYVSRGFRSFNFKAELFSDSGENSGWRIGVICSA